MHSLSFSLFFSHTYLEDINTVSLYILQLLRHSNFSVFSAALRAVCLLLQDCRVNLRLQVEWGLIALMDLFSTETSKMSHIRKEAVLETIVQVHVHVYPCMSAGACICVIQMYIHVTLRPLQKPMQDRFDLL